MIKTESLPARVCGTEICGAWEVGLGVRTRCVMPFSMYIAGGGGHICAVIAFPTASAQYHGIPAVPFTCHPGLVAQAQHPSAQLCQRTCSLPQYSPRMFFRGRLTRNFSQIRFPLTEHIPSNRIQFSNPLFHTKQRNLT